MATTQKLLKTVDKKKNISNTCNTKMRQRVFVCVGFGFMMKFSSVIPTYKRPTVGHRIPLRMKGIELSFGSKTDDRQNL